MTIPTPARKDRDTFLAAFLDMWDRAAEATKMPSTGSIPTLLAQTLGIQLCRPSLGGRHGTPNDLPHKERNTTMTRKVRVEHVETMTTVITLDLPDDIPDDGIGEWLDDWIMGNEEEYARLTDSEDLDTVETENNPIDVTDRWRFRYSPSDITGKHPEWTLTLEGRDRPLDGIDPAKWTEKHARYVHSIPYLDAEFDIMKEETVDPHRLDPRLID